MFADEPEISGTVSSVEHPLASLVTTLESLDNRRGGGDSSSTICFSLLILSVASSLLGNKEGGKLGVSAMLLIAHSVIT